MDLYPRSNNTIIQQVKSGVQIYMTHVYGWMSCGLLLTSFVSWWSVHTPALMNLVYNNRLVFLGLVIVQLSIVFILSGSINFLNSTFSTALFMIYSVLTGLTISSIFFIYTYSSIASMFLVTAGMFGIMSFLGYVTDRDLTKLGSLLFMSLIGITLVTFLNLWLKNSILTLLLNYISIFVFVGLTAYDTQKLKRIGEKVTVSNKEYLRSSAIVGALVLYLDFINLFIIMIRNFGNRR